MAGWSAGFGAALFFLPSCGKDPFVQGYAVAGVRPAGIGTMLSGIGVYFREEDRKMRVKTMVSLIAAFALVVVPFGTSAMGDEIADQIREGLGLYEKGNYSEAVRSLSFAVGQIQQKQASGLKDIFPDPLEGWKAKESTGDFTSASFLGGGISASRHYYKDDSDRAVDIEIVTDSPLLQSVLMFYNNPAFHAGQPGTKLVKIKNRNAIQRFSSQDREGEMSIVIGNRMLVSIKARGMDKPDEMVAFANAISYDRLEKFLQN
jgi:hypothetical protein